jgi:hypothetical protein
MNICRLRARPERHVAGIADHAVRRRRESGGEALVERPEPILHLDLAALGGGAKGRLVEPGADQLRHRLPHAPPENVRGVPSDPAQVGLGAPVDVRDAPLRVHADEEVADALQDVPHPRAARLGEARGQSAGPSSHGDIGLDLRAQVLHRHHQAGGAAAHVRHGRAPRADRAHRAVGAHEAVDQVERAKRLDRLAEGLLHARPLVGVDPRDQIRGGHPGGTAAVAVQPREVRRAVHPVPRQVPLPAPLQQRHRLRHHLGDIPDQHGNAVLGGERPALEPALEGGVPLTAGDGVEFGGGAAESGFERRAEDGGETFPEDLADERVVERTVPLAQQAGRRAIGARTAPFGVEREEGVAEAVEYGVELSRRSRRSAIWTHHARREARGDGTLGSER